MTLSENEKMLFEVAHRLPAELLNQVVFLGGAVVGCLITDEGMGEARSTQDVDLVVEINSDQSSRGSRENSEVPDSRHR